MWLLVVGGAVSGQTAATLAGAAALGLYLALRLRHLPLEPLLHLAAAAGLSGWVLWRGDGALVAAGLGRGATVAALFVGLSVLRHAAAGSRTVLAAGALIAAQPPGRRYLAMTLGAHAVALILNFGVVNLLGPMVASLRGEAAWPLRRSLGLAILRGFSCTFLWSPLTLSFGVVTAGLAGVRPGPLMATGAVLAALLLLTGFALDRAGRGRGGPALAIRTQVAPDPAAPRRLLGVILLLLALVWALHAGLGVPLIMGVILGAPLFATGWLTVQQGPAPRALARAVGTALAEEAVRDGRTIALLGAAALMGTLIGGLLPGEALADLLERGPLPAAVLPGLAMAVVILLGIAGANPLLSVVLLLGVLPEPAAIGVLPEALALALIAAWGLTTGVSRAGASLIHTAQAIGSTPAELGLRGNLGFTVLAATVVTLATAAMPLWL